MMTSRERILAAIEFTGPDRCPIHHYIFPGGLWRHGQKLLDLVDQYPDDFGNEAIVANLKATKTDDESADDVIEWTDAFGTLWRRLRKYTSGDVVTPAVPDWDAWASYDFPAMPTEEGCQQAAENARAADPEKFVALAAGGFFQAMENIRGPENCWMDLVENNEGINELADLLVERNMITIRGYAAAGVVDCIRLGDDWGSQDRLLIRPETWREFFKPRYAKMFELARDAGIHVWFHTDGYTLDILEDLIEIGVTVINPQHACMGTRRVAEICGGRVCIRTDIDRQWVIPTGTPAQVVEAVREVIEVFGNYNGGVILHGEVGPEVPYENIEAMYAAFYEFGEYPLTWLDSGS